MEKPPFPDIEKNHAQILEEQKVRHEWAKIEQISVPNLFPPYEREQLLEVVEQPLKEAVGVLYDKNIPTLDSSCNEQDYERGRANVSFDWEELSEPNRHFILEYGYFEMRRFQTYKDGEARVVGLFIPIEPLDKPEDLKKRASLLVEKFETQQTKLN